MLEILATLKRRVFRPPTKGADGGLLVKFSGCKEEKQLLLLGVQEPIVTPFH